MKIFYGNIKVLDGWSDGFNDIIVSKITINDLKVGKMCLNPGFLLKKNYSKTTGVVIKDIK